MAENLNKINTLYFEGSTMKELYGIIQKWKNKEQKRLLSLSIQKDGEYFACIALSNPTEVVITDRSGQNYAYVNSREQLNISDTDLI